jgi:catechol 2,3-dioxygenase-like lactoylglutathione lyase family enzyme
MMPSSPTKPVRFECVRPILNVRNVPASLDYYVQKLGFRVAWTWEEPATFAAVQRDGLELFLCQRGQGHPGTWLAIFVDDVDALHAEYLASGAIIRQAPTNFPWGTREMNVEDPDGHRIRMTGESTGQPDGTPLMEQP